MKIAICDDEKVFVNKIYQYLWQQTDCSVECFLSPSALLEKYEAGERYDVIFLDILMKPVDGISLSKTIRNYDAYVIIVFLTAYLEYAPAGYEIKAFRYLLKPISEHNLSQVMKDIRHELETSRRILLFKTPQCELILHTEDILYLEANDKDTTIHCRQDTFSFRKGLEELSAQLPELFFRIHRKYIVNLAYVREFDGNRLTLDNGRTLPVSRRRNRDFREKLRNYIEGGLH